MNSSQHLLVLMSIILGFGIRELLIGGRAAAVNRSGAVALLPFAVGLLVLVAIVQFWWYLFIVANRGAWSGNFFLFAATLLRPALLFISAASVFPTPGSQSDLMAHYLRNRVFIYVPLALFEAQNLIESASNLGTLLHPAHGFHVTFIAIALVLAVSAKPRLHKLLLALLYAMTAVFIGSYSLSLE